VGHGNLGIRTSAGQWRSGFDRAVRRAGPVGAGGNAPDQPARRPVGTTSARRRHPRHETGHGITVHLRGHRRHTFADGP
jgi:Predicted membrane protein